MDTRPVPTLVRPGAMELFCFVFVVFFFGNGHRQLDEPLSKHTTKDTIGRLDVVLEHDGFFLSKV